YVHANGQFPATAQLVVDPGDDQHLAVLTTFGILESRNGGAGFRWLCEDAVGYTSGSDPTSIAIFGNGSIIAGVFDGLAMGTTDSCGFAFAPSIGTAMVTDVSVPRELPSMGVILRMNADGSTTAWSSSDTGMTWLKLGKLPLLFITQTIDLAPSNPLRVYAG